MQDTIRQKILTGNDTLTGKDVKSTANRDNVNVSFVSRQVNQVKASLTDTVSDCTKGPFSFATFSDSSGFLRNNNILKSDEFPFNFIDRTSQVYSKREEILLRSLKEGDPLPEEHFRTDWLMPLLLFSFLLLGIVRSVPGNTFRNMFRFLFMRGINENASRDTGILFQWKSTLLNLSTFISLSIFCYLAMMQYDIQIPGINRFLSWLICLAVVILAVTLRHIICFVIGNISDEPEIFREYIIGIYQIYRFGGILFLLLSVMILYTVILPVSIYFIIGIVTAAFLYLLRVIRLFLIFITRHVSILYLILYLCALEILPVVILVKYVTGLV